MKRTDGPLVRIGQDDSLDSWMKYHDWWNECDQSVPFTKPQVIAFIFGISVGMGWVKRVSEAVGHGGSNDEILARIGSHT